MTLAFGATPAARGYRFLVWAPHATSVELRLRRGESPAVGHQLSGDPTSGIWEIVVEGAQAGDRYAYSIDGRDPLPDPASRFLPDGVHGWSEIVDPRGFRWTDEGWRGLDPRRAVIYELHVGTFTPEGTFRAAAGKLPFLRDLGVTAVELMPLADFAGTRNWGYDGVAPFAPSRAYGRPDDLRAFIDAAHQHGLAVLIDAVYNHLGPEGAYLPAFSRLFHNESEPTPWGAAVNLDGAGAAQVRRLFIENAVHWIREYHADGLRLDATHSLVDRGTPHLVAELTQAVHEESGGRALVYAEDARNQAALFDALEEGGWGIDGIWADDFHHVVRRMLAGDAHSYYQDFKGTAAELVTIFHHGWLFTGQHSTHRGRSRGTEASHVPLRKAVICIQNHDQIGNRAFGDRLNHVVDAATWRAATALLLTAPMTPLLFMGQEWAASTPFQFFTDFEPGLGDAVVKGRREEFAGFPEFASPEAAARIPNPQAIETFAASRLRWAEIGDDAHARALALTRRLLALRAAEPALHASERPVCEAEAIGDDTLAFVREDEGRRLLVVARLRGSGAVSPRALGGGGWTRVVDTEDPAFAGDPRPIRVDGGTVEFARPGAIVLSR